MYCTMLHAGFVYMYRYNVLILLFFSPSSSFSDFSLFVFFGTYHTAPFFTRYYSIFQLCLFTCTTTTTTNNSKKQETNSSGNTKTHQAHNVHPHPPLLAHLRPLQHHFHRPMHDRHDHTRHDTPSMPPRHNPSIHIFHFRSESQYYYCCCC